MAVASIIAGATVFGAIIGAHAPDSFRRQHIPVESTNVVGATLISAMPGRVIYAAIRFCLAARRHSVGDLPPAC